MTDIITEDNEEFERINYNNDDVDTDRGVWRQRSFTLCFKSGSITMSETDFFALKEAIKKIEEE